VLVQGLEWTWRVSGFGARLDIVLRVEVDAVVFVGHGFSQTSRANCSAGNPSGTATSLLFVRARGGHGHGAGEMLSVASAVSWDVEVTALSSAH
jgi:hypothetical protein